MYSCRHYKYQYFSRSYKTRRLQFPSSIRLIFLSFEAFPVSWKTRRFYISEWEHILDLEVLVDGRLYLSWPQRESVISWAVSKQCGQQGKGGDSAPLFCLHETLPAVLCPAQEEHVGEPWRWSVAWSMSLRKTGWERWNGLARRREGSRKTLLSSWLSYMSLKWSYKEDGNRHFKPKIGIPDNCITKDMGTSGPSRWPDT